MESGGQNEDRSKERRPLSAVCAREVGGEGNDYSNMITLSAWYSCCSFPAVRLTEW